MPERMKKMDKKLEKLYKKAQVAGFDSYELEQLQKELNHHKQKMDEFNQLRDEIDTMGRRSNKKKKRTLEVRSH